MLLFYRKGKNSTQAANKICVVYGEGVEQCGSGMNHLLPPQTSASSGHAVFGGTANGSFIMSFHQTMRRKIQ